MLKVKVLGKDVTIDDDGAIEAEDDAVIDKLFDAMKTEVDTSQGLVNAGTFDDLSTMVLLDLVDPDFEIVSGSVDAHITKRLVQEGDVLEFNEDD
jgi:hypothetical protein